MHVPVDHPLLLGGVLSGCDICGDARDGGLYLRGDDGLMRCCDCWRAAGSPWPRRAATVTELHEAEVRTRARMMARGSTDRHLVRKGLS